MLIKKLNQHEKKQLFKYILFTGLAYLLIDIIAYFTEIKTGKELFSLMILLKLLFAAFGMGSFIWFIVNRGFKKS